MILNLPNTKLQIRKGKSLFIGLKVFMGQNLSQPTIVGRLWHGLFSSAHAAACAQGPQSV
jgi:hypothetical protein